MPGPAGDLIAACAVACAGFGVGMLTFDAFAFVQCTLIFFVITASGCGRARSWNAEHRPRADGLGPDAPTMARGAAVNVTGALLTTVLSFALTLLITHRSARPLRPVLDRPPVAYRAGAGPAGPDIGAVRFVALRASRDDVEPAARGLADRLRIVGS